MYKSDLDVIKMARSTGIIVNVLVVFAHHKGAVNSFEEVDKSFVSC